MITCIHCSVIFTPTKKRQKVCSRECIKAASYAKTYALSYERQRAAYKENPDRFKKYKEKYQNSPKGKAKQRIWYEANKQTILERMKQKPDYLFNIRMSKRAWRMLNKHRPKMCEICSKEDGIIDAHHKDLHRDNNSIENLQWLCRQCHAQTHVALRKQSLQTPK